MLADLFRRAPTPIESRSLQVTPWGPWEGNPSQNEFSKSVSADAALQLLAVHGCVSLISDTIATLPRYVYSTSGGTTTALKNNPRWLEQPNRNTDIIDFLTQTLTSLLLDGNAYWAYGLDGNFLPAEITVLDPTKVNVKADKNNNPEYWVNAVKFTGRLLHIRGITRPGQLKGFSPVEAARRSISIGLAAQQFAEAFYDNGTVLSGVIQVPGQMTKDQARELKAGFSRDHGGAAKAHQPGILTNGATWSALSITPEQAQFLQSREYQAAEIAAQLFLLDPSMLGMASAGTRGQNLTYANLEQRGIHLVQYTLLRWIIRLERAFDSLLPGPQYMKFNVDGLQRADLKTRYESYRIALGPTTPFLVTNEPREFEELPPLPGGDQVPAPIPAVPFTPDSGTPPT